MYRLFVKRLLDFIAALLGFVVLLPLILALVIILYFANDGKPFFYQTRPGKDEKLFKIIKFKTMNDRRDAEGNLLPDMQRITNVGRFVRKASLDELLQLINVIKGDMSVVGPRPLLVEYLPLYNAEQARRHQVKPGITGWAQVNGRNAISWEEKFALDVWYVDNLSFATDLKILGLTIKKVFRQEGISASEKDTMQRFTGSPRA
ncbi:sugar transferase [Robiginitalea sp. SC105]|uniref:sugar transferase n=1 Tax=Robiginitalea sp. SC105 TaxID=2762332 RepID=UPI00163A4D38|nr:sugar transferase [Robiginitalea sp. SC105]MBC2840327.1 sugar transferase [Robiginitalea sp. SC105]